MTTTNANEPKNQNQPIPDLTDGPKPAPIEPDDPDAILLAQAIADREAEKAAAQAAPDDPAKAKPAEESAEPAPAAKADQPAAAEPDPKAKDQPKADAPKADARAEPMIPKARFDQVLQERDELLANAAYWKGRAEATVPPGAAKDTPAPPEKTPQQILDDLDQQKVALAEKFEAGEIGAGEWKRQETALDRRAREVMTEMAKPAHQPASPTVNPDLFLEERTKELEQNHPYVGKITSDADWAFIEAKAKELLAPQGIREFGKGNLRNVLALRSTMAELTDIYGPMLLGESPQAPAGDGKGSGGQGTETKPGMSTTAADRAKKLDLAAGHPVDTSRLGTAGADAGVSKSQVETMSDEEITALPESTRRRLFPTLYAT